MDDAELPTPKTETELQALGDDMFAKILKNEDITEDITTDRGTFVVKYPLERDMILIDRHKALMRGGIPALQFDSVAESNMELVATLDVVIMKGPEWWQQLKGSANCPDHAFLNDLYRRFLRFFQTAQSCISRARPGSQLGTDVVGPSPASVGRGLFSNFTLRPHARRPQ